MEEINLKGNIKKLKSKYKVSDDLINKILYSDDSYHPMDLSTILINIDMIDEAERVGTIIELLNKDIGMSYETLAAFGKISVNELKEFLEDRESLNEKKKFIFAVRMVFLHFVLKEKYTIGTDYN